MSGRGLESREAEIIRMISILPKEFIVIGGYATSALSTHRFSVDCDIVVSTKDANELRDHLEKQGYKKVKSATGFGGMYQSEVDIYARVLQEGRVSVDLFVNGVTSRSTGASWSYAYIRDNSTNAIVSGTRNSAGAVVPTKELLIAMKIHSARDADLRDIVMLSEGVNWDSVTKHCWRGNEKVLLKLLTDIIGRVNESQFVQALRATFELRYNVETLTNGCRTGLSQVRAKIESHRKIL
ncbi:MAG: hypothetical protein MN733_22285 [Nitrososphaera sp.]|nr:hypothetical protein [Nitrososphaera sp.]